MTRVKICGLTRAEDALAAARAGADALGFILAPSKRRVSLEAVARITRALPPFVTRVGVFVNESEGEIRRAIELAGLDMVQLHGSETPEFCARFPGRAVKAMAMDQDPSDALIDEYQQAATAILLDTGAGGSGRAFDWGLIPQTVDRARLILAGGLGPENVGQAIEQVQPWAVDAASSLETAPGIKDHDKLRRFIRLAKEK